MPGVGVPEMIVILIIGFMMLAVPIAVVVGIVLLIRNQRSGDAATLREENQRLRDEIAELKRKK